MAAPAVARRVNTVGACFGGQPTALLAESTAAIDKERWSPNASDASSWRSRARKTSETKTSGFLFDMLAECNGVYASNPRHKRRCFSPLQVMPSETVLLHRVCGRVWTKWSRGDKRAVEWLLRKEDDVLERHRMRRMGIKALQVGGKGTSRRAVDDEAPPTEYRPHLDE